MNEYTMIWMIFLQLWIFGAIPGRYSMICQNWVGLHAQRAQMYLCRINRFGWLIMNIARSLKIEDMSGQKGKIWSETQHWQYTQLCNGCGTALPGRTIPRRSVGNSQWVSEDPIGYGYAPSSYTLNMKTIISDVCGCLENICRCTVQPNQSQWQ
jgi:hypothetical protein